MSTLVVHMHNGRFPRTRFLRDQPVLFGAPYHVLMLLLERNEKSDRPVPQEWTQDEIARRLGQPVNAVRKAFATLRDAGYWASERRSLGRGRWRTWWAVTDKSGDFGEFDRYIAADIARLLAGAGYEQVATHAADQPLIDNAEPPVMGGESSSTPLPPAVGTTVDSRVRSRRGPVDKLRRQFRARDRLQPPTLLPDELLDVGHRAIRLAHDLGIPTWMRVEVAGYVAVALRAGDSEDELLRQFSARLEGTYNQPGAIRWRARNRAEGIDPALVAAVQQLARERYGAKKATRQARQARKGQTVA